MNNKYKNRIKSTIDILQYEIKCYLSMFIGRIKIIAYFDSQKQNKLEIGAGKTRKTGFITCDLSPRSHFPFDLRAGLPFPDRSIDFLYAEHVFEHFAYKELVTLLSDCYRVLKPNGVISISVPDPNLYIDAYKNNIELNLDTYAKHKFGLTFKSKIDYLNHIFYLDGQHRYMFDAASLQNLLLDSGFTSVRIRNFDSNIDQEIRKDLSIYADARKVND